MAIMNAIRVALRSRREAKRARQYDEGWNWAAGQLLNGAPPEDVLARVDGAALFEDTHPFDNGAKDACMRWIGLRK